jgi:hypothetical protein
VKSRQKETFRFLNTMEKIIVVTHTLAIGKKETPKVSRGLFVERSLLLLPCNRTMLFWLLCVSAGYCYNYYYYVHILG